MHSTVIISLAFGLLGIDSVVASPCKPSSLVTTTATETSTSEPSSSLLLDTTVLAGVPEATTTTTIAVSESSLLSTDIESTVSIALSHTSGLSTESTLEPTATSIEELSTQTTSDATSSSAVQTSTAALPIPTLFSLTPHSGPTDGEKLVTTGASANTLALGVTGGQWYEAQFTYDEATGHLLIGTQAMCVFYYNDNRSSMTICPTYDSPQFAPMVCEPPTGRYLKCSVPGVKCVSGSSRPVCTSSEAVFKTFYSGLWFGTAYQVFLSEADRAITDMFDPIDLVVNAL